MLEILEIRDHMRVVGEGKECWVSKGQEEQGNGSNDPN